MPYGLNYIIQFSSTGVEQDYRFEILKDGYEGPYFNLIPAGSPVVHSCQVDEPKAPIKGSALVAAYINEGANPVSSFYSPSDTTYKGILYWGTQKIWEGFMVQGDPTSEILIDTRHEVSLLFTDGLGLLKDITLDRAYQPGLNPDQTITEELYTYRTLADIIKHCLYSTGLLLDTQLFENIFEQDQINHEIFIEETSVDMRTFLDGDKWNDCYTVLEKILGWYGLTLVQANGMWNIVRWNELRYYNSQIPGYLFNKNMLLQGSIALNDQNSFGASFVGANPTGQINNPETGMVQRLLRPYKFVQKTMNYKRPENFTNANFLKVGDLLRQYTSGTGVNLQTFYEYEPLFWTKYVSTTQDWFIRVIKNYLGTEIERYMVGKGVGFDDRLSLQSEYIEVAEGDLVSVSFQCRGAYSVPPSTTAVFAFSLKNTSPALQYWADEVDGWRTTLGWSYHNVPANEWFSVDIKPINSLPKSGALSLFLNLFNAPDRSKELHYKDIVLDYQVKINESVSINGHVHKNEDTDPLHVIKNNEDTEIFVDDSPKNSILGTTFNKGQDIGLLHKRTLLWYRGINPTERYKIGEINTFEQLFWRRITRTILEGTINGICSNGNHISPTTVLAYDQLPGYNFIFGQYSFDYRNNRVSGTLWEMYQTGEVDGNLNPHEYTLTYLYKKD